MYKKGRETIKKVEQKGQLQLRSFHHVYVDKLDAKSQLSHKLKESPSTLREQADKDFEEANKHLTDAKIEAQSKIQVDAFNETIEKAGSTLEELKKNAELQVSYGDPQVTSELSRFVQVQQNIQNTIGYRIARDENMRELKETVESTIQKYEELLKSHPEEKIKIREAIKEFTNEFKALEETINAKIKMLDELIENPTSQPTNQANMKQLAEDMIKDIYPAVETAKAELATALTLDSILTKRRSNDLAQVKPERIELSKLYGNLAALESDPIKKEEYSERCRRLSVIPERYSDMSHKEIQHEIHVIKTKYIPTINESIDAKLSIKEVKQQIADVATLTSARATADRHKKLDEFLKKGLESNDFSDFHKFAAEQKTIHQNLLPTIDKDRQKLREKLETAISRSKELLELDPQKLELCRENIQKCQAIVKATSSMKPLDIQWTNASVDRSLGRIDTFILSLKSAATLSSERSSDVDPEAKMHSTPKLGGRG